MDETIQKLIDASKKLPDQFDGKEYDNGIIKKEDTFTDKYGTIVSIQPVEDNNTYLGILIGNWYSKSERSISSILGNPIIYVFKLKKFVRGFESFSGPIPKENLEGKTCSQILEKYKITNDLIQETLNMYLRVAVAVGIEKSAEKEKREKK